MIVNKKAAILLRGCRSNSGAFASSAVRNLFSRASRLVVIGATIVAGWLNAAHAQDTASARCLAANPNIALGARLARTAARLKTHQPLTIVAIGSSSTVGLWMLSRDATYPEVMRREILRLRPNTTVNLVNSGRVGDTIPGNIARFDRDVFAHQPDLVIWQLGTNDIAWGGQADQRVKVEVTEGIRALKAASADVVLMDLQYAPQVLGSASYPVMEGIIADAAKQERVGLFPRFALMQNSVEAGVAQNDLVTWDGLHNTSDGYDCIGRALARAISDSAR